MPYANLTDRRQFEARRAKQRRVLGLCAHCSQLARTGGSKCQPCADRYSKRVRL